MLWKAKYCYIRLGRALTSPGASSSDFYAQVATSTGYSGASDNAVAQLEKVAKNVTFKEPERDSETIPLLGTTSGAQNAELDEKGSDNAELTCTMVMNPEVDNDFKLLAWKLTEHGTVATSYDTRYNYNSAAPTAGVSCCVQFSDGTNIVNFLLNNCSVTTLGGFSVDADGSSEQEMKIVCAPDDCWMEENFCG